MNKYKRKVGTVEAVQWNGDNLEEIRAFIQIPKSDTNEFGNAIGHNIDTNTLTIASEHLVFFVSVGDWVIKTKENKCLGMDQGQFNATYEVVEE